MNGGDWAMNVAVLGIGLWLLLGLAELVWSVLVSSRRDTHLPFSWTPRLMTLPGYDPMYRWGHYNIWRRRPVR